MSAPAVPVPAAVAGKVPPLHLPVGSVRALITLSTLGTVWYHQYQHLDVPPVVADTLLLVLGYYFGTRNATTAAPAADAYAQAPPTDRESNRRDPLFLPRGMIRLLIIVGFGALGFHLWNDEHFELTNPPPEFALLAGFLGAGVTRGALGRVGRRVAVRVTNWVGHLMATGTLAVVFAYYGAAIAGKADWLTPETTAAFAGIVGFYMGKR